MKKFICSGVCVSANMMASLLIVSIIVTAVGVDERAMFFLFQAVFFPITALLSQTKTYLQYRGVEAKYSNRVFLVLSAVVAYIILRTSAEGMASTREFVSYSLSIPFSYLAATTLAKLQHQIGSTIRLSIANVIVAAMRIGFVFLGIKNFGAPDVFLAGSVVFFIASKFFERTLNAPAKQQGTLKVSEGNWVETLSLMLFFVSGSIAFQWDKVLFSLMGEKELIVSAGVYSAFMLSPISVLYATLTRADSSMIFNRVDNSEYKHLFNRMALIFCTSVLFYLVALVMFWDSVRQVLFPFFEGGSSVALVLGCAVAIDRLANLRIVLANDISLYRKHGLLKLITVVLVFNYLLYFDSDISLEFVYTVLVAISIGVFVMGSLLCRKIVA